MEVVPSPDDFPSPDALFDAKSNGDSIKEVPDESSWDDDDSAVGKQSLAGTAMDVWRANIAQYMSKLEIEMISAHGIPKSSTRGFPSRSDDSFFAVLRYGKTVQKTLVAHARTTDPVCSYARSFLLIVHSCIPATRLLETHHNTLTASYTIA